MNYPNSCVTLFAYRRPFHTFKTLESLARNKESKETDLYVFIDGPKDYSERKLIESTKKIVLSFKFRKGTWAKNMIFQVRRNYEFLNLTSLNKKQRISIIFSRKEQAHQST